MTSTQMRAAVLMAHSSPLQIGSVLRPTATDGQVLVRIKASAVNPLDLKIHKDRRRMRGIRRRPFSALTSPASSRVLEVALQASSRATKYME
jgi:NADPH:quinone reductase-like Zn-dependent oxidoreductase